MELATCGDGGAHSGRHGHGRPLGWADGFGIVAIVPIGDSGAR